MHCSLFQEKRPNDYSEKGVKPENAQKNCQLHVVCLSHSGIRMILNGYRR